MSSASPPIAATMMIALRRKAAMSSQKAMRGSSYERVFVSACYTTGERGQRRAGPSGNFTGAL